MTENTSTEIPNYRILPKDVPVMTRVFYNGISLVDLARKSSFPKYFPRVGVRKFGKFKQSHDFLPFYFNTLWDYVMREVIDNESVVSVEDIRIMIKSYRDRLYLVKDLFKSDFQYRVPVVMIRRDRYVAWGRLDVVDYVNNRDNYVGVDSKVIIKKDLNLYLKEKFPELPSQLRTRLTNLCIWLLRIALSYGLNPSLPYRDKHFVFSDNTKYLGITEGVYAKVHRAERAASKHFDKFLTHVTRNIK